MRSHEASSESLKNRSSKSPFFFWKHIPIIYTVRFSLKNLEKGFAKTEDDIKAVQSVGQIVGEVMKQLDTDRCK
jgi:26S proteasome regulatory subunit T4